MLNVDKTKCRACGICVNICPAQAIALKDNTAVIDKNKCVECLRCVTACPTGAISSDIQKNSPNALSSQSRPFIRGRGRGMAAGRGRGRGRGMGRARNF